MHYTLHKGEYFDRDYTFDKVRHRTSNYGRKERLPLIGRPLHIAVYICKILRRQRTATLSAAGAQSPPDGHLRRRPTFAIAHPRKRFYVIPCPSSQLLQPRPQRTYPLSHWPAQRQVPHRISQATCHRPASLHRPLPARSRRPQRHRPQAQPPPLHQPPLRLYARGVKAKNPNDRRCRAVRCRLKF